MKILDVDGLDKHGYEKAIMNMIPTFTRQQILQILQKWGVKSSRTSLNRAIQRWERRFLERNDFLTESTLSMGLSGTPIENIYEYVNSRSHVDIQRSSLTKVINRWERKHLKHHIELRELAECLYLNNVPVIEIQTYLANEGYPYQITGLRAYLTKKYKKPKGPVIHIDDLPEPGISDF
jgi:hypothetical protein